MFSIMLALFGFDHSCFHSKENTELIFGVETLSHFLLFQEKPVVF